MTTISDAVAEYMRLEREQNATVQGCDHWALLVSVALTYRLNADILRGAIKDATLCDPN